MVRQKVLWLWAFLGCAAGALLSSNGCGDGSATFRTTSPIKLQHIVVIFQENRTPDNLFQDPKLITAGADIKNSGLNSLGQTISLTPVPLATLWGPNHSHKNFLDMYDGGKMDGADKIEIICPKGTTNCAPPNAQFTYVNPSVVAPYFQMAETYAFGDRMFQTNQGPSFPAHQYIISGSSGVSAPGSPLSTFSVAENPVQFDSSETGCIGPPDEFVYLIDRSNSDPLTNETQTMYPCVDHPTLTDLLDADNLSWKYYTPTVNSIWTGPVGIEHLCGPNAPIPNATACAGSIYTQHVVASIQVLSDITQGQLPAVSWVIPSGQNSDHAQFNASSGPSWVASIVNAIGNSPYWSNTAIVITWDDWGGFYDHVAPTVINPYEYGFRVPLIVVSPYSKQAYVSHQMYDFGSILKFIENNFGLSNVAPGYADANAANDLSDCFDFSQAPSTFHTIQAPLTAQYFLNDKSAPLPPDND